MQVFVPVVLSGKKKKNRSLRMYVLSSTFLFYVNTAKNLICAASTVDFILSGYNAGPSVDC